MKKSTKMIIKPVSIELLNSFIFWTIIGLVLNLLQLQCKQNLYVSGSITSTPYPDANAKPTITTKLENLSDLHRSSISSTTTSTEGYLNTFNDDDKYGNYNAIELQVLCNIWRMDLMAAGGMSELLLIQRK